MLLTMIAKKILWMSVKFSKCFSLKCRFIKMDTKEPPTLLELTIQCLLSNEHVAIQGLEEIPRELFVPLFTAAFAGSHKKTLTTMVQVWPFTCLHIGSLSMQEPQHELLKDMIESLQFLPAPNSASR